MSYLGSTPTTQSFIAGTDSFNGTGAQTSFTLSRAVNSVNDVQVVVNNVVQYPPNYSVSGNTLTISPAPSSGTNNVYVRYLSTTLQSLGVGDLSVSTNKIQDGAVTTAKIADGSVTTAKIAASAVTPDKLSSIAQYTGFKNRIINGAMEIDQRNAGALLANANGGYGVDRFVSFFSPGTITARQLNGGPTGFARFLRYAVSSAGTRNAVDYYIIGQLIEGFNVEDFGLGSAGASSFTFTFWARSSVAGLYSGCINSGDNTRGYGFNFTINAANTWELKSITIPGDTSGGTTAWGNGNGIGMFVRIDLGSGSNYQLASAGSWLVATNKSGLGGTVGWGQTAGATFDITGVQLEKGSTATSFDYRDYGRELMLCQRYYQHRVPTWGTPRSTDNYIHSSAYFKVTMRAAPTLTQAFNTYGQSISIQDVTADYYVTGASSGASSSLNAGYNASIEL